MTLRQLQERRERLVAEGRERLDQITDATDDARRAELEAQHDAAMAELDQLDADIDRRLCMEDAERRNAEISERLERGDERRPRGNDEVRGTEDGEQMPSYREAFHAYLRSQTQNGLPLSSEYRAVLAAGYAELEQRAQTTANAEGGYTVPEEMADTLIRSMAAWGPMYEPGFCTDLVTDGGGPIPMPTVDDTGNEADTATAEGETLVDDGSADVVFGEKVLNAFAYNTKWIRVSLPLLQDSMLAIEALLNDLLGERMGRTANRFLTVGTGSGQPHGIVTAAGLGRTAASVSAITYDEIIGLEHSVNPAYREAPKVRYMFNDDTLETVRKIKDGDGNYLWQAGNVRDGVPPALNGRPYRINQAMANIGASARPIVFGDFGKYFVRKVGQPLIGAIGDKDFWPGIGMAGYNRFDGELGDTAAVKAMVMPAS